MKIATFNIQNIFSRDKDLLYELEKNKASFIKEFDALILQENPDISDLNRMRELETVIGFNDINYWKKEHIEQELNSKSNGVYTNAIALKNKLEVIKEVNPDILVLQEVESKIALEKLNQLLKKESCNYYYQELLYLDTNQNGLGMGILLKSGFSLDSVRTFSNVKGIYQHQLFDKDIQEYRIKSSSGQSFNVLNIHFIELGKEHDSEQQFLFQSEFTSKIVKNHLAKNEENLIVLGTFNAPRYSKLLGPIMNINSMKQAVKHPVFSVIADNGNDAEYYSLGAYRMGVNIKQQDHILINDQLYNRISSCGMNRKGMWPNQSSQWKTYKTLKKSIHQASKHPLLWVTFDVC